MKEQASIEAAAKRIDPELAGRIADHAGEMMALYEDVGVVVGLAFGRRLAKGGA